jgi:hypothetical protein
MAALNQDKLTEKLAKAKANLVEPRAVSASYDVQSGKIGVILSNGSAFSFPAELGQGLAGASPEELATVEVTPSGEGLHWESLDADLSIPTLMAGIFGTKQWMAEIGKKGGCSTSSAKAQASRQNGKKGGRPPKQESNFNSGNQIH